MNIKIGFVVSEFNNDITSKMLEHAKKHAKSLRVDVKYICYVPGTFDMPLMIEKLLRKRNIDAVVTLGAIIKGETKHDEIIANTVARLIADLSLRYSKPVTFGISGPDMSKSQARDRINAVSIRAVTTAVRMTSRIKQLRLVKTKNITVIK